MSSNIAYYEGLLHSLQHEHMKGNIRPEYFQRNNDLTSKKAMKHKVGRMVDPKMSTVN